MKFFVKWLLDTFPDEMSAAETETPANDNDNINASARFQGHILDVAGGKGELAARLCMCHKLQVVMVDPRTADVPLCFESLVLPKIPKKWQERLDHKRIDNPTFIADTINERFRQLVMPLDEHALSVSTDLQQALQDAALLVGMHADGATEAIVDAALVYKKPFVVVPCCVFPNLFQQRRVPNAKGELVPVRNHEQFCEFLLQKDARFRMGTLPFEGRNVAIWWDGKS